MTRRSTCSAAILAVWVSLATAGSPAFGESHPNTDRGFRPERAYQSGDIDHINLFNGGLTLVVPLGPSYPVREGFSYQLKLAHNSKLWDFKGRKSGLGGSYTIVNPNASSNAGMGWMISLGRLFAPFAKDSPAADAYVYVAPDGAEHRFYSSLHEGEQGPAAFLYTRDGSYMRLRLGPPAVLELPDGTFYTFDSSGRPAEYRDRFGNGFAVAYAADNSLWTISDTAGRQHYLNFQNAIIDSVATKILLTADLAGFNGARSVYTFLYTSMDVPRRGGSLSSAVYCLSTDPMQSDIVDDVPMLTQIQLPTDASTPIQTYAFDYNLTDNAASCRFGTVASMTLPTRGRIAWDYADRPLPSSDCEGLYGQDPYTGSNWPSHTPAVASRSTFDWTGAPLDTWTYSATFSPNPDWAAGLRCEVNTYPSREEETVIVTDPRGLETRHYFSAYIAGRPSQSGYNRRDHGLPFSRSANDPHGRGTFISSETCFDASCAQKRAAFVLFEQDYAASPPAQGCTVGNALHVCINRNRRIVKQTTTYENDQNTFSAADYSDFDGLGHYRHTTLGGNYGSGNTRLERTQWNPSSMTYPGSFSLPATSSPWLTELFSYRIEQEGATGVLGTKVAQQSFDFDTATGFLRCVRGHASFGSSTAAPIALGATDTLVKYGANGQGNSISEQWFGGDVQALPTSSVCAAPGVAKYAYTHGYASGVRSSTTADLASGLRRLTLVIDANTGLASQSRIRNSTANDGALTTYTYDLLGRLRTVAPASDATTEYVYANTADTAPSVDMKVGAVGNPDRHERWSFDGMGRLVTHQMRLPDASNLPGGSQSGFWSYQHTRYSAGAVEKVSERTTTSSWGIGVKATVYSGYDALGRPGTITAADGTMTTLTYAGNRLTSRASTVFGASGGPTPVETLVTTTEEYDRQGRLYQVTRAWSDDDALRV